MPRALRALVGAVLMVVITACSSYRAPVVTTGVATLVEVTDEAARFDIEVDLENPNDEPLELLRFSYHARVGGHRVYSGLRAAQATLGASGTARLSIPVVVRRDQVGPGTDPVTWSVRGRLTYVTPGEIAEILLDAGVKRPKVGFRGNGAVRLGPWPEAPSAAGTPAEGS